MSHVDDPIMEAVEALLVCGHTVEPIGDEFMLWLVNDKALTDGDLLALAIRLGLMDSPGGLQ